MQLLLRLSNNTSLERGAMVDRRQELLYLRGGPLFCSISCSSFLPQELGSCCAEFETGQTFSTTETEDGLFVTS